MPHLDDEFQQMAQEHMVLLKCFAALQQRCTEQQQAFMGELSCLQTLVVRLRAELMLHTSVWAWANEVASLSHATPGQATAGRRSRSEPAMTAQGGGPDRVVAVSVQGRISTALRLRQAMVQRSQHASAALLSKAEAALHRAARTVAAASVREREAITGHWPAMESGPRGRVQVPPMTQADGAPAEGQAFTHAVPPFKVAQSPQPHTVGERQASTGHGPRRTAWEAAQPPAPEIPPFALASTAQVAEHDASSWREADRLICQTGCISAGDHWRADEQCRRTGKACVQVDPPPALKQALTSRAGLGECLVQSPQAVVALPMGAGLADDTNATPAKETVGTTHRVPAAACVTPAASTAPASPIAADEAVAFSACPPLLF